MYNKFMQKINVRRGSPKDAGHFSELVVMTSPQFLPAVFGSKVKNLMCKIFQHRRHYFSFDNSFFVEVNGKVAGMAQLHKLSPRRREKTQLIMLLLKYMTWRFPVVAFNLLKSEQMIRLVNSDCYLSSVAIYPEYRGLGLGTRLLESIEEEAKSIGKKRIVLHAETYNTRAMSLYERLGYKVEHRAPSLKIRNTRFESFKYAKPLPS